MMARPVRGCPTPRPQQEDMEEPVRNPQQEEQSDATESKVIANYSPDIDYEGSEPKVESDAQEQREVDSDPEYTKMEMPREGILHQKMMHWEMFMHKVQGPEIMALWLQDMCIHLGFSPKAA